jgi:tRNA pseudouridine38-40 synthase
MVRLIVGTCITAGMGQIAVEDVKKALEDQTPLLKSLSVPPEGLFLTEVRYPYLLDGV